MRRFIDLALAAAFAFTPVAPALADSKSAAEFALNTCLAAMDDLANVEAIAREHNWNAKPVGNSPGMKSQSFWEVLQGGDRFIVMIATMTVEKVPPLNVCSVFFPGRGLNRDEFSNLISASAELTLLRDNTQPRSRSETYEIKSDRTNQLMLTIMSQIDGTLMGTIMQEMPRFAPRQPTPAIPG